MIKSSKQNWTVGQTVKVGFLSLQVRAAIPTPDDFAPDVYLLSNAAGDKLYEFVPHCGLNRIELTEARDLLAAAAKHAAQIAADATQRAARGASIDGLFAQVAA